MRVDHGDVFCADSDLWGNLYLVYRRKNVGFVDMLSTHMDDILVRSDPFARLGFMNLSTSRFDELLITQLGPKDPATELTHCGLEIEGNPDRSSTVSRFVPF